MAARKVIAVVGATGAQGGGLARAILADPNGGFACRAITRDPVKDPARALAGKGADVVKDHAVEADVYRGFGFPGVDELGNMFQVYRDFEKEVLGARSIDLTRALNPSLQTFDEWLARNKSKIPLE